MVASAEEGLDRRQVLSKAWKAALSLSTLGVAVTGVAPPAGAGESPSLLTNICLALTWHNVLIDVLAVLAMLACMRACVHALWCRAEP